MEDNGLRKYHVYLRDKLDWSSGDSDFSKFSANLSKVDEDTLETAFVEVGEDLHGYVKTHRDSQWVRKRIIKTFPHKNSARDFSVSVEPLTADQERTLLCQGSNKDSKSPCVIDDFLTSDPDVTGLMAVGAVDPDGNWSSCYRQAQGGATETMRQLHLSAAQKAETVAVTPPNADANADASGNTPTVVRNVPRFCTELHYNHTVHWGMRSIMTPTPRKRGRVSPFDKAFLTVSNGDDVTNPDAFRIGLLC